SPAGPSSPGLAQGGRCHRPVEWPEMLMRTEAWRADYGAMASDNFVNWKAVGIAGALAIAGAGGYLAATGHDSRVSVHAGASHRVEDGATTTTEQGPALTQPPVQNDGPFADAPTPPTTAPPAAAGQAPPTTAAGAPTTAPPATAPRVFIPPRVAA